jgi:endonuclease-3
MNNNSYLSQSDIEQIFKTFSTLNPAPKSELNYTSDYTFLIAVLLSARATDISVNKATKEFFAFADTPEKMLALGETSLKQHISAIGLYNTKAKNILALSKILIEKFQSSIPNKFEDLVTLPGIGIKSANVILNCIFGKSTIGVDTHVFRVSNRIGLCKTKTPEQTSKQLLKIIPIKWQIYAAHWLVLHGRYICKAKNPLCTQCSINHWCSFYNTKRNQ